MEEKTLKIKVLVQEVADCRKPGGYTATELLLSFPKHLLRGTAAADLCSHRSVAHGALWHGRAVLGGRRLPRALCV